MIQVMQVLILDKVFHEKILIEHLLLLKQLHTVQILVFHKTPILCYLNNIDDISIKDLKKALYIAITDLCGKLYLSFVIMARSLLIFAIALSICCLKLSFSSSIRPRCFEKMLFRPEYY